MIEIEIERDSERLDMWVPFSSVHNCSSWRKEMGTGEKRFVSRSQVVGESFREFLRTIVMANGADL